MTDERLDVPDLFTALRVLLMQIPRGRVTTYGDLADALGDIVAARWVASFLADPDCPKEVPAHRVLYRDGAVGKGAVEKKAGKRCHDKERLLAAEGITVTGHKVDLPRFGFKTFTTSRPLRVLHEAQNEILAHLRLLSPIRVPDLVAGVDVSYSRRSQACPVDGVAAYALVDVRTGELVWSTTVSESVRFPYITGLLAFRELPILLSLLSEVRRVGQLAEVVMVDGNGILHQRHAGIASHLGVIAQVPTIGIGKSLLCGSLSESAGDRFGSTPVVFRGETVAHAIRRNRWPKPVFVSPGHLVDLPFAVDMTRRVFGKHSVPDPIFHAHTISRRAAAARGIPPCSQPKKSKNRRDRH